MLQFVDSQQEFDSYGKYLDKYSLFKSFSMWNPGRAFIFWSRFYMYSALFNNHYKIPFNFLRPGLEIKYACEESTKQGSKTYFLGPEFNGDTWSSLLHETRTTLFSYFLQNLKYWGSHGWHAEKTDLVSRL